jgi:uncharacterized protein YdaU (DUF1376 family)
MHYFKFNIGDYHKKAGRLSMLEHGAYTLLIHACYDRERFPTEEEALDWCWARTEEEIQAVKFVLSKFFDEQDGRFYQKRIEDEITNFHLKSEKNREIAIKREADRRTKRAEKNTKRDETSTNRERNAHEPPPNHKPITNNHNNMSTDKPADDLFSDFWDRYPRKEGKKKAEQAWRKLNKSKKQKAIDDVLNRFKNTDRQYIPLPATYINGERWEDEKQTTRKRGFVC